MEDNVISVEPETDQEDVARLVSKYDLHAIPVVNKRMGIIGIITVDDIIDVIEEENTEDMLKLGGVNKEEDVDSSALESVHMRLPWLLVNLVTAFWRPPRFPCLKIPFLKSWPLPLPCPL